MWKIILRTLCISATISVKQMIGVYCTVLLLWKRVMNTQAIIKHVSSILPVSACAHSQSRAWVTTWTRFLTGDVRLPPSDSFSHLLSVGLGSALLGGGLGSQFISCHWNKYTPWQVHDTSATWQMCCTWAESETNGCQLTKVKGRFKLNICAVCHNSWILFCALLFDLVSSHHTITC